MLSQKDQFNDEYYDKASFLQDFAVEVRYPNDTIELKNIDVEKAIEYAQQFCKLIIEKMDLENNKQ